MSLVATTRKLGISFFEYVRDRITRTENIESLAQIIRNKTALICLVGRGRQNNCLPLIIEPIRNLARQQKKSITLCNSVIEKV